MTAIEFTNISKQYRLGLVSTGTLCHDLNRFWQTHILHREDPYLKIGAINDRTVKGNDEYVWALQNINLHIEEGDVVGIIGRNGSGKSTLLKILSRITSPTTGIIRVRGRIASLLEVGTGFHREMTGRENIYMNGSIMGMSHAEITKKLDEIVDFSGCERYLDTPIKRYSSGMAVRLGFAVAAFIEPEILVVDEVLAVGDAEFQQKAIGKMQDVSQKQGRTILFVSHNMGAVRHLCKTGVLLNNGQIAFTGTAEEAIDHYAQVNIQSIHCGTQVTPAYRISGTGQIRFTEIQLLNGDPAHIASDEPLELLLKCKRVFSKVEQCQIMIYILDATDTRILGYLTNPLSIPQQQEFSIRLTLKNHHLVKRKYKMAFSIGSIDYSSSIQIFDAVGKGIVSFEVTYMQKESKIQFSPVYARYLPPILHQDDNMDLALLE